MTKQEADFIGSMNMCDEISNEAYKKIMCHCEVEEQQPCEDCISRQTVIDGINQYFHDEYYQRTSIQDCRDCFIEDVIKPLPSVNPQPKTVHWRPIKIRPLTEKEKEYFVTDVDFIYECDLPDDGETVLITDKWGNVETDTFYRDEGCYFEDNSGEDDVVAWMPLPQPAKLED